MHRQIVLDTETTGLSPQDGHRLIEVGCIEMLNRRITGERFHRYINPERPVDPGAFQVHGLSDDFLKDKLLFTDIAEDLLTFIGDAELIIHNAPFDLGFLNHEFKRLNQQQTSLETNSQIIDTLVLARRKHPGQANNLDALCRRYRIDNSNRDLHGALLDARLLALVYLAMTGGQEQLFTTDSFDQAINQTAEQSATDQLPIKKGKLAVLQPNPEEQAAHEKFIENLKKNGACLWE